MRTAHTQGGFPFIVYMAAARRWPHSVGVTEDAALHGPNGPGGSHDLPDGSDPYSHEPREPQEPGEPREPRRGGSGTVPGGPRAPHPPAAPPPPQGRYAPAVLDGGLVVSAGMTPRSGGRLTVRGRVGADVDVDTARQAAGLAARNAFAAVTAAIPPPSRLRRCLRMTVYVACAEGFTDLSAVADGASDALADALAAAQGRDGAGTPNGPGTPEGSPPALPARSAVGVLALPSGAPVEVELSASVDEHE